MNRTLFQSFKCAFKGLFYVLKTQRNMRIHFYLATGVILAGVIFGLSAIELAILCCVISFVLIAEIVNTTLEVNLDFLNGEKFHPVVKTIKDIFASAVLIASINAVIVGTILFLPHLNLNKNKKPEVIEFKKSERSPQENLNSTKKALSLLNENATKGTVPDDRRESRAKSREGDCPLKS